MEDKFLDAKPSFPSRADSNEDKFSNLIFQMVMVRDGWGPLLIILLPFRSPIDILLSFLLYTEQFLFNLMLFLRESMYSTSQCLQTMDPKRQYRLVVRSSGIVVYIKKVLHSLSPHSLFFIVKMEIN